MAMIGLIIVLILIVVAVLAPVFAADPFEMDIKNRFAVPSWEHPFGTDNFGRDILARVLHGARISLQVGVVSVVFGLLIGVVLGATAAYLGGAVDNVSMRVMDALLAFPSIMLALLLRVALGPSITSVMIAIAIIRIPIFARTVRSSVLAERERDYVVAATSMGQTRLKILFRHILPNSIAPLIVLATVLFANAIIIEASMSFLGIGTPPPQPSWGIMLSDGRQFMESHPHVVLFPGLAISLVVLGVNLLGDGLRDAMDPRLIYQSG
jgi:ABC-type dipeptide/oligopeptide/nickel transport system permease subunit